MKKLFKKIKLNTYLTYSYIKFFIGTLLANVEADIFGEKADLNEKNRKNIRMRHKNNVLEKFYQGQRDDAYTHQYYELLRKADKFMKSATPEKMAIVADKFSMSYGMKDKWGRRYEHYGFYDEKSKHAGKTLAEVIAENYEERRTKDDNYPMITIFNNKPIEAGLTKALKTEVKKTEKDGVDHEYETLNIMEKSKQFVFPIKVYRDTDVVNKIEQLTQFLHLKKITEELVQLEFFIPLKFKTTDVEENSDIFNELTTMKHIGINDEYGVVRRFGGLKYKKRLTHDDFDVIKFIGVEAEDLGIY